MSRTRTHGMTAKEWLSVHKETGFTYDLKQGNPLCGLVPEFYLGQYYFRLGRQSDCTFTDATSSPGTRSFNPCTHTKCEAGISSYHLRSWHGGFWASYITQDSCVPVEMPSDPRSIGDHWGPMIVSLSDQVRSRNLPGSSLLVTLAELEKTIRMVKNPFGLLKPDWRQRAGSHSAAELFKRGANLWLEGRYGWQAAYLDLKGYAKSWLSYDRLCQNEMSGPDPGRFSQRTSLSVAPSEWVGASRASLLGNSSLNYLRDKAGSSSSPVVNSTTAGVLVGPRMVTLNVGCKAKLYNDRIHSRFSKALQALKVTSSDILPALWELTPYSFVVDWFVDLQGISRLLGAKHLLCSAMCSDLGYSIKSETYFKPFIWSTFWGLHRYVVKDGMYSGIWDPWTHSWTSIDGYCKSYTRVLGLPNTGVQSFFNGLDLSAIHRADGIGLIIQKMHR